MAAWPAGTAGRSAPAYCGRRSNVSGRPLAPGSAATARASASGRSPLDELRRGDRWTRVSPRGVATQIVPEGGAQVHHQLAHIELGPSHGGKEDAVEMRGDE